VRPAVIAKGATAPEDVKTQYIVTAPHREGKRAGVRIVCEHHPTEKGFTYSVFGQHHVDKLNAFFEHLPDNASEAQIAECENKAAKYFETTFIACYFVAPKGTFFGAIVKSKDGGVTTTITDGQGNVTEQAFDAGEVGEIAHNALGEPQVSGGFMCYIRVPHLGQKEVQKIQSQVLRGAALQYLASKDCKYRLFKWADNGDTPEEIKSAPIIQVGE
jgi:hypothetical protein